MRASCNAPQRNRQLAVELVARPLAERQPSAIALTLALLRPTTEAPGFLFWRLMRILCIVPAGHEADYLHKGLKELAYGVDVVHNLEDGLFYCAETAYDVLIAGTDGVTQSSVERLVAACAGAALIVITTEDSSTLRTAALRAGADTCLTRPWSFMELQARLQVLERRGRIQASASRPASHPAPHPASRPRLSPTSSPTQPALTRSPGHAAPTQAPCDASPTHPAAILDTPQGTSGTTMPRTPASRIIEPVSSARPPLLVDAFRLDPASRSLVASNVSVPLSRREYLVLECLMRDPNAAISRDQLLAYAWTPNEHADASTVNTLISRLRAKASTVGVALPLETVVGHGYRFLGLR